MALLSDYTSGTITVAADGTAVTGVGTGWVAAGFREGDLLFANGYTGVVKSVESNTALTLDQPWQGGALSGASYRLRYQSDGSRFSAQARALMDLLGGSGNLEAFGSLEGTADTLAYFTGPGQMGLTGFTEDARALLSAVTDDEKLAALGFSPFMAGLRTAENADALLTDLKAVSYVPQTFSSAERQQARENIGVDRFLSIGGTALDVAGAAAVTIDWSSGGYFTLDLTSDTTVSFSNILENGYRFLLLTQDAVGGHSATVAGKLLQGVVPYPGSSTLVRLDAFSATKVIATIVTADNSQPLGRYFDGSSSMVLGPDRIANLLSGATQITFVARVRVSGGSGTRYVLSAEIDGPANLACAGFFVDGNGRVVVGGRSQVSDGFQSATSATQIGDGWHTIAGVMDIGSDTISVGVDGVFSTSVAAAFGAGSFTPGTLTRQDRIAEVFGGGGGFWVGDIADVAIFRRSLSAAEFHLIHRGVRPDALPGIGPVVYFPMDDVDDGFAVSRIGGLVAKPNRGIAKSDDLPTIMPDALSPLRAEQRFDDVRAFRLRAADITGLSAGAAITAAPLRHSGVNAAQANGANQPTYQVISGRSAVRFTSAENDFLTADIGKIDIRRGFTAVAIASIGGAAGGRVFSLSDSTVNENGNAVAMTATEGLIVGAGTSGNAAAFSSYTDYTLGTSGTAIFAGRFSGVEVCNWLNGVKRNGTVSNATEASDGSFRPPAPPNGLSSQLLQVGRRLHGSNPLSLEGDIYDMILVEGALTDEEVRYLEGVLAWENNFVNLLPAAHPWKTAQPSANSPINYIWGGTASSIVARSDAPNSFYEGGPSLIRSSDGLLYCLHDTFDPSYLGTISRLHVSRDDGATWHPIATFDALEWGTLWQHTDGHFYIMGVNRGWGDVVLGKSIDLGRSWSWTTLSSSGGPLAPSGSGTTPPNYHSAPGLPPLYHDGYIFKAFDNLDPYTRETTGNNGFKAFVLYIDASADLMNKANWQATSQLAIGAHSFGADAGFFEGQVVADDNDALWAIYRFEGQASAANKGVLFPLAWDGATMTMPAWSATFIKDLPGGNVKIPVFKYGGYFYIVANEDVAPLEKQRNRSVLLRAPAADLSTPNFTVHQVLVDQTVVESTTGMNSADSMAYHGFQYAGFFIEDDIVHVTYRLAWSGANSYHNSNFVGYGRFDLAS